MGKLNGFPTWNNELKRKFGSKWYLIDRPLIKKKKKTHIGLTSGYIACLVLHKFEKNSAYFSSVRCEREVSIKKKKKVGDKGFEL